MKRIFTISGLVLLFFFFINTAFAQNSTIKGKVTDATTGETLIGVSVSVKGTSTGTQTDVNGAYTLAAPSGSTLTFTYIGYATQQIAVNGQTELNVKLLAQASELQQVVVIGYGTQRKLDNTGSVSSVKGVEVSKQASTNALSALQGKVSGVNITNNGTPGSSPLISIRGLGTIYGNVSPLFVVDGTWYSDISFLNNNDIENVTILKDASSTAIYGVRAANGVVLITTKHGVKGRPVVNYNGYAGWQAATNGVKMADATEYATAVNELVGYSNHGVAPGDVKPPLFDNPASFGKGTDWYGQILRNAFVTNHQVSLSGGTDKVTYDYSFGYLDQDGLVRNNNYKRYTLHFANDFTPVKALKIGYSANGLFSKSNDIPGGIFHQLYAAAPTLPVFYKDGTYGDPADYGTGNGNNFNPEATLDFTNSKTTNHRLTGDVHAELAILKNLKFRTSFGGDIGQTEARVYLPVYKATIAQNRTVSNLGITHNDTRNWIWENTLTYDYKIKDHKLTALVGYSAQNTRNFQNKAAADNVPYTSSGNLHTAFPDGAAVAFIPTPGDQIHTRTLSQFGRINYSFQDKYLLNASIRRDGASQFFPNPYGWFPSIGGGWVITNEQFMKDQHIFDNLKLRGSWGKVGNSVVPINPSIQTVSADPYLTAIFGNPQVPTQGASINTVVPPFIVWEKGVSSDFGIEGAFLHNRLSFEADYYNRKTEDAIFAIPILASVGTNSGSIIGNQATIQNKGFEFVLSWKDQPTRDFSYSFSGNLGVNTNKVLSVLSGKNPIYSGGTGIVNGNLATRTVVGEPIGEFYGYKVTGVFQTAAEVAASNQKNAQPGDFIYQDLNGDHSIDTRDRTVIGNPNPKISYGFNTAFTYKQFDLAIDLQGVADVDVYNANIGYRFANENFTQDFYDHRWHGAGTSNTYPSTNIGSNDNSKPNTFFVESGAYFRVRNAQLGYTLPGNSLKKYGVQKIRFYANAQNAINIFGYKGFTPEIGGAVGNKGIDADVYPLFATYNFGVNVTF
ncbi:SusC/RagA family TonB-linked outer membrane protein [Mucilaginibacter sp. OK098]|uniref:SusC/RagA family TonB-linked outer membrane protein n=1 Tax=Mucilaginibacter sp. OK098 TaxID=1855297 RepID=UPI00091BF124|nr:TonB-dependent receptor [Mucilaginibacter sp. OK098]SHN02393.1 TonB-linked outer membrane protein, SusC/RagA family [Mucilaginibacter sp. OK098]